MPKTKPQNLIPAVDSVGAFEGLMIPASPYIPDVRATAIEEGRHERPERTALQAMLREGDRLVELGAGIGFLGALAAKTIPDLQLLAYEANPELLPTIQDFYALNQLTPRAEARNEIVIADPKRPEHVDFHIHGSYLGSSLYRVGPAGRQPIKVPTVSWSAVKAAFRPTILLMDIEGAELDFLAHADLSGLRAVILEFHPNHYGQDGVVRCRRRLRRQGFEPKHRFAGGMVWGLEHEGPDA